jgi:hypothetical protein
MFYFRRKKRREETYELLTALQTTFVIGPYLGVSSLQIRAKEEI